MKKIELKSVSLEKVWKVMELACAVPSPSRGNDDGFYLYSDPTVWRLGPRTERKALEDYLGGLNEREQAEMMALMWFGRPCDYRQKWKDCLDRAKGNLEDFADYMAGKMDLADYLRNGLRKLGLIEEPDGVW